MTKSREWTAEQRARHSERMREYWATHEHPRKGVPTSEETKERMRSSYHAREVRGYCRRCCLGLSSGTALRLGFGQECVAHAIDEGLLPLDDYGKPIPLGALEQPCTDDYFAE